MIIRSKPMARRTVLRGMGATLALPLLEAMMTSASAAAAISAVVSGSTSTMAIGFTSGTN